MCHLVLHSGNGSNNDLTMTYLRHFSYLTSLDRIEEGFIHASVLLTFEIICKITFYIFMYPVHDMFLI